MIKEKEHVAVKYNNRVSTMKKDMEEVGFYTEEDIIKICDLEQEYDDRCENIRVECGMEGYPEMGSNYDLRCEQMREEEIEPLLREIDEKYE